MIKSSNFLTVTAFLSWLKLSVYMSIVAVAIVLNFHLKSKPSTLGKRPQRQHDRSIMLTRRREEVVTSARYCVLATVASMPIVGSSQLHQYSLRLQPPSGTCSNRLENTDCIYCGRSSDSGYLRVVIVYKCAEPLDAPISFIDFVNIPSPHSSHTQQHFHLGCSPGSIM